MMTLMITYTRSWLQTDMGGDQQIWHSIWKQLDKTTGSRQQGGDVTKINLDCPFFKHCGIILNCLVSQIISWSHNCLHPPPSSKVNVKVAQCIFVQLKYRRRNTEAAVKQMCVYDPDPKSGRSDARVVTVVNRIDQFWISRLTQHTAAT